MNNPNVIIDWKFVVALGVAPAIVIMATKLDASRAEKVLTAMVNACRGVALIDNSECELLA